MKSAKNILFLVVVSASMMAVALAFSAVAKSNAQSSSGNSANSHSGGNGGNANKNSGTSKNQNSRAGGQGNSQKFNTAQDQTNNTEIGGTNPNVIQRKIHKPFPVNFGQTNAAVHQSAVASFVKDLLQTANTADNQGEVGIGKQVRAIAVEQTTDETTTETAMEEIQERGKIKTFILGPDYKNIGQVRSSYVHTRNRIRQLNRLLSQTTDPTIQADLQSQIDAQTLEQNNILTFIQQNENKFSLLGWFMKLVFPPPVTPDDNTNPDNILPTTAPIPPNTAPIPPNTAPIPPTTSPEIPTDTTPINNPTVPTP